MAARDCMLGKQSCTPRRAVYEGFVGMQWDSWRLVDLAWDPTGDFSEEKLVLALSWGATFTLIKYVFFSLRLALLRIIHFLLLLIKACLALTAVSFPLKHLHQNIIHCKFFFARISLGKKRKQIEFIHIIYLTFTVLPLMHSINMYGMYALYSIEVVFSSFMSDISSRIKTTAPIFNLYGFKAKFQSCCVSLVSCIAARLLLLLVGAGAHYWEHILLNGRRCETLKYPWNTNTIPLSTLCPFPEAG